MTQPPTPDLAAIEARWARRWKRIAKEWRAWAYGCADTCHDLASRGVTYQQERDVALTAAREATARAERAEAALERYAYDCDSCLGMGTAGGRMAQGSPPCEVCKPARAALATEATEAGGGGV